MPQYHTLPLADVRPHVGRRYRGVVLICTAARVPQQSPDCRSKAPASMFSTIVLQRTEQRINRRARCADQIACTVGPAASGAISHKVITQRGRMCHADHTIGCVT